MWDSMGPDDQETICFGWNAAEDVMLESFLDGSEDAFDEGQVRDFFDSVC